MTIRMADVSAKPATARRAAAVGALRMSRRAFTLLRAGRLPKGDALAAARIAGIQAAKNASALLPLCHPLALDVVQVDFTFDASSARLRALHHGDHGENRRGNGGSGRRRGRAVVRLRPGQAHRPRAHS